MNKKAFEMSVGFLVIIIMTILIFSLSLSLIFKWFGQAEEFQAEIDKQTKEQILSALRTGSQLVVIPLSLQEVKRGNLATFGVGVKNVLADSQFSMAVGFSGAYYPDGRIIGYEKDYVEKNWLGGFSTIPTFTLKRNQQEVTPVVIKADVNVAQGTPTPRGDYTFNICVYNKPLRSDGTPEAPCNPGQFKTNPEVFYTQKMYQVTVRVV